MLHHKATWLNDVQLKKMFLFKCRLKTFRDLFDFKSVNTIIEKWKPVLDLKLTINSHLYLSISAEVIYKPTVKP